MYVKQYGIYIAYPPTVDLRNEGLGRYLAAFLKGAATHPDVHFVLVCPSWSREGLQALFLAEGVPGAACDVIAPVGEPPVLRIYKGWLTYRARVRGTAFIRRVIDWYRSAQGGFAEVTLQRLVRAHSIPAMMLAIAPAIGVALLALMLSPFILMIGAIWRVVGVIKRLLSRPAKPLVRVFKRLKKAFVQTKGDGLVVRMYRAMELAETQRMAALIEDKISVRAWYSPTAFWPAFNNIQAPRLMCVPDVVLTEFPVGFSQVGDDRFLQTFELVEQAIAGGEHFVTYSDNIKWETLVDRYAVRASNVAVVHHAPNDLSRWVTVNGFDDVTATSQHYCEWLLSCALRKSFNPQYANGFLNGAAKFLFYASQFRPNKNLISLLKAYEYLLRKRLIGHKLILTGNPNVWPPVQQFIKENNLENDVLCLHGLKIQELAACYKLADLAVNPSLSEGGCPFTFTEALSVDTPVVMARIPVTEEVLTDAELQEMTFFDPYDWRDMAARIEWALNHRNELLVVQRKTYAELSKRTWTDVVDEHLEVLERISLKGNPTVMEAAA